MHIFDVCFLIYLDEFCSVSFNSMVQNKIRSVSAACPSSCSTQLGTFLAAAHHGRLALLCACLTTAVLRWGLCSAPCRPNILHPTHQRDFLVRSDEALTSSLLEAVAPRGSDRANFRCLLLALFLPCAPGLSNPRPGIRNPAS